VHAAPNISPIQIVSAAFIEKSAIRYKLIFEKTEEKETQKTQIRNPRAEIRKKAEIRRPKARLWRNVRFIEKGRRGTTRAGHWPETRKKRSRIQRRCCHFMSSKAAQQMAWRRFGFRVSSFFRPSDFGLRIST
jgi:hypothetical protein